MVNEEADYEFKLGFPEVHQITKLAVVFPEAFELYFRQSFIIVQGLNPSVSFRQSQNVLTILDEGGPLLSLTQV